MACNETLLGEMTWISLERKMLNCTNECSVQLNAVANGQFTLYRLVT